MRYPNSFPMTSRSINPRVEEKRYRCNRKGLSLKKNTSIVLNLNCKYEHKLINNFIFKKIYIHVSKKQYSTIIKQF